VSTLNDLQAINYHDSLVLKLTLDFDQREIELILQENVDEVPIALRFSEASSFSLTHLNVIENIEVHTAEFKEMNDYCLADFIFLLGPAMPSWNLSFKFSGVVVQNRTSNFDNIAPHRSSGL